MAPGRRQPSRRPAAGPRRGFAGLICFSIDSMPNPSSTRPDSKHCWGRIGGPKTTLFCSEGRNILVACQQKASKTNNFQTLKAPTIWEGAGLRCDLKPEESEVFCRAELDVCPCLFFLGVAPVSGQFGLDNYYYIWSHHEGSRRYTYRI